ncbi:hypothetical protein EON79_04250 [bacterium]|nr:MAG: hypothetical protein EON79_04250 [bacterium]
MFLTVSMGDARSAQTIPTFHPRWRISIAAGRYDDAASEGEKIFLITGNSVTCISRGDGKQIWTRSLSSAALTDARSKVALVGDRVLVHKYNFRGTSIYLLDKETGRVLQSLEVEGFTVEGIKLAKGWALVCLRSTDGRIAKVSGIDLKEETGITDAIPFEALESLKPGLIAFEGELFDFKRSNVEEDKAWFDRVPLRFGGAAGGPERLPRKIWIVKDPQGAPAAIFATNAGFSDIAMDPTGDNVAIYDRFFGAWSAAGTAGLWLYEAHRGVEGGSPLAYLYDVVQSGNRLWLITEGGVYRRSNEGRGDFLAVKGPTRVFNSGGEVYGLSQTTKNDGEISSDVISRLSVGGTFTFWLLI